MVLASVNMSPIWIRKSTHVTDFRGVNISFSVENTCIFSLWLVIALCNNGSWFCSFVVEWLFQLPHPLDIMDRTLMWLYNFEHVIVHVHKLGWHSSNGHALSLYISQRWDDTCHIHDIFQNSFCWVFYSFRSKLSSLNSQYTRNYNVCECSCHISWFNDYHENASCWYKNQAMEYNV